MEQALGIKRQVKPTKCTYRLAVLCPVCGKRVCDISPKSRMDPFSDDDTEKPPWEPDVYVRCAGCKTELALYRSTE